MENRRRIIGFDYIRAIAAFMVCVLHSSVARDKTDWLITSAINDICQVSVPLFFMVSGAVNLSRTEPITFSDLFQRKIPKLAIPFALWSFVYVCARIITGKIPLSIESFTVLLYEPAYYQFWFMYTLLAIHLLLPILQTVVLHISQKQYEYLLLIWCIFSIVVPMMQRYIPGFFISDHVDLILCEGYIGYFMLGFYLIKYPIRWNNTILGVMYLGGSFLAVLEGYLSWTYNGYWYSGYLTIGTMLSTIALFVILVRFGNRNHLFDSKISRLSLLTENIYYVHMLVLTAVEALGFTGRGNTLLLYVKAVIVFALSTLIAWLLQICTGLHLRYSGKKQN